MDLKELQNKIKNIKLGKEKIILLALAGLLLIASSCFEKGKEREETPRVSESIQENTEAGYQAQMERKIKRLLESVKKISDVTVVINLKSGSEKIVKEDSENTQSVKKSGSDSEKSSVLKKTTVVFNRSGR